MALDIGGCCTSEILKKQKVLSLRMWFKLSMNALLSQYKCFQCPSVIMYLICTFKKYSMNYVVDPRKLKTKSRVNCVKNAKKAENNSYGKTSLNLARFYFNCVLVYLFFRNICILLLILPLIIELSCER